MYFNLKALVFTDVSTIYQSLINDYLIQLFQFVKYAAAILLVVTNFYYFYITLRIVISRTWVERVCVNSPISSLQVFLIL